MADATSSAPAPAGPPEKTQYLAFTLVSEKYAIELLRVSEILEYAPPTRVPGTPPFIAGVINLRGAVVPIVDLRAKLGLPPLAQKRRACIAVVEVRAGWGEGVRLGLVADSVDDIVDLAPEEIETPPPFGTKLRLEFLRGVGKARDALYLVLELDRVLSPEELSAVDRAASPDAEAPEARETA